MTSQLRKWRIKTPAGVDLGTVDAEDAFGAAVAAIIEWGVGPDKKLQDGETVQVSPVVEPSPAKKSTTPESVRRMRIEAKARHEGMILLWRVGDSYEAIGDDALAVGKALVLRVHLRDGEPLCSFHADAVGEFMSKLLTTGLRVALCDESPAEVDDDRQLLKDLTAGEPLDLSHFTGTENYYRHWSGVLNSTDGVRYVADELACHWLIDVIASYQRGPIIRGDRMLREFQVWYVKKLGTQGAAVECWRDTGDGQVARIRQEIEFTDFAFDRVENDFKLYLRDGVLMLPSEY